MSKIHKPKFKTQPQVANAPRHTDLTKNAYKVELTFDLEERPTYESIRAALDEVFSITPPHIVVGDHAGLGGHFLTPGVRVSKVQG